MLLEPARRIEDDAQRARAGDVTGRQLRVVGCDRAGADDDRVAQRTHAVHVQEVLGAGDVLRFAGVGRDEAVEALPEMADRDRAARWSRCRSADTDQRADGGRPAPAGALPSRRRDARQGPLRRGCRP